ncbi:hypothetical protein JRC04_20720 [Mycolicibacterium sp. S2-37]|uniref:hypothetical protein n=1 Tax=Mycolicibacterium sp. S2-37 TaxID=2810297 RepID=UPI001A94CA7D|nr:hypothetical protein [Mycolicibacterium sp. S2-37]MBO0679899.1 hypothetical protein [Mycolicibacterium sp. S2-37]
MSNVTESQIEEVAPGDLISVDRGEGAQAYKVVHKNDGNDSFLITLEGTDGETFDKEFAAGTTVTRSLESKWESDQSPTPHAE